MNGIKIFIYEKCHELSDSLNLLSKYKYFGNNFNFDSNSSVEYHVELNGITCIISAFDNLNKIFFDILREIRYKRFSLIPVLFLTSEKPDYLVYLSRKKISQKGFECVSCGRGNFLHLKIPFIISVFKEKIDSALILAKEEVGEDDLDYLLHCQTKVILYERK